MTEKVIPTYDGHEFYEDALPRESGLCDRTTPDGDWCGQPLSYHWHARSRPATDPAGLDVERLATALWGMRWTPDASVMARKIAAEYARLSRKEIKMTNIRTPQWWADQLYNDLAFAAPELWKMHIERRFSEASEINVERLANAYNNVLATAGIGERVSMTFWKLIVFEYARLSERE